MALIFNSVVLLTFSAALLGVNEDSDGSSSLSHKHYVLGFVLTLGASVTYSLILSLMQVSFGKVVKRETFSAVLNMQIYTGLVATCTSVVSLFASSEWTGLKGEMDGFKSCKVSYIMTQAGTAVSWQVSSIGVLGLVFVVSSLFSNVISTLALPVVPVFAVIFFKDKMDVVKVIAMLIAIWGFASYVYQHYLDDLKGKEVVEENIRDVSRV
jgi:Purine nucleobase transmembrane transport